MTIRSEVTQKSDSAARSSDLAAVCFGYPVSACAKDTFILFRRITHMIDILIRDQSQTAVVLYVHFYINP